MAKASDNAYPSVLIVPGAAPVAPGAGQQRLFLDSADGNKLKRRDSAGSVVTVEGGAGGAGALALISDVVLAATALSVGFTAIPGTYKHLHVRFCARSSVAAATDDGLIVRANGDTAANYDRHRWSLAGATTSGAFLAGETHMYLGTVAGSLTAGVASSGDLDIQNYTGTDFNKTLLSRLTTPATGGLIYAGSGVWKNISAITSLTFSLTAGTSFGIGSRFSLYGVG